MDHDTCCAQVKDLKAELELRKVDTGGVMEKEELARLLADARASGRADPTLIDEFNKQNLEKDLAGVSSGESVRASDVSAKGFQSATIAAPERSCQRL